LWGDKHQKQQGFRLTATSQMHPVKMLIRLYDGEATKLFWALFFYCIKHAGVWLWPLLTANIIDVVSNPQTRPISDLWLYAAILFVVYVQNIPFNYVYMHFFSTANRNMERHLRARLTRRLQRLSMSFYQKKTTGALQTKMLRDVEVIEQLTKQLFESIPITLITIAIAVIVTAIRAPWFLLFFVLFIPVTVTIMKLMQRPLQKSNRHFREEVEGMSTRVIEMLTLIPVTRAHSIEHREINRVDEKLQRVRQAGRHLDQTNALFGSITWVSFQLATSLCLITAAYFSYTQILPITVGDVVLLTGYFTNITNGISQLVGLIPQITKGFESVYSLQEILEEPDIEQNEGKQQVENIKGYFLLDNVSFAYPDSDETSIKNITLGVQPGETIAFVGASGAGKSTLINLLIGFIRPTDGRILIDDMDMNRMDLRSYRHHLSVVPQKTILFDGTIRDNIAYGVKNVSDETIWQALEQANAATFVRQLP
jgi:ATP-binding cassette, subfamily B, bacterial